MTSLLPKSSSSTLSLVTGEATPRISGFTGFNTKGSAKTEPFLLLVGDVRRACLRLRTRSKITPHVLILLASTSVALLAGLFFRSSSLLLIELIAISLCLPLARRQGAGVGAVFSPIVWANLALGALFVMRPVADILAGRPPVNGVYDLSKSFDSALVMASIGILALQIGYLLPFGSRVARSIPKLPSDVRAGVLILAALGFVVIALSGYAAYLITQARSPSVVLHGLDTAGASASTAYFYYSPLLLIPAVLLLLRAGLDTRRGVPIAFAVLLLAVYLLEMVLGFRRLFTVYGIACPALYLLLRSRRAPSLGLVLGSCLLAVAALTGIRYIRTPLVPASNGNRPFAGRGAGTLRWAFYSLTELNDLEGFDGLAAELQTVPRSMPFSPGSTLMRMVTEPVPRLFWKGKPRWSEDELNDFLYRDFEGGSSDSYSLVGVLYADSGLIGIVAWMLAIGIGLRALNECFLRNRQNHSLWLCYAPALPLVARLMQTNPAECLSYAIILIVPLLFVPIIENRAFLGSSSV